MSRSRLFAALKSAASAVCMFGIRKGNAWIEPPRKVMLMLAAVADAMPTRRALNGTLVTNIAERSAPNTRWRPAAHCVPKSG